ncbi:MAG: response regulator transcription factor [Lachnospiraceae bacterium]|nr:response regulator transcription factor [Lachnospiraceae bacterium]
MIKILLVDDEPLLLESLEIVLTLKGGFEVCGTAGNGIKALEILKETHADVMLIDLNMPGMGGIELIKKVKELYPEIRMVVLTTFYDEKNISEALSSGASGYLLKDSGKDAIIEAVNQAVKGVGVLDAKVLQKLTGMLSSQALGTDTENKSGTGRIEGAGNTNEINGSDSIETLMEKAGLTDREKEIARLLAEGCTNSQIASVLYISEGTVKNYVSIIYDKFDIRDRAKLVVHLKG